MELQKVWVPDNLRGFMLGHIVDIGGETVTVQLLNEDKDSITADYSRVYPAEEDDNKDADDNCGLMYLNEATLLNNIRLRYKRNQIYTYVGNILIAVNPYNEIKNLYSSQTIKNYMGKSLGVLPPHAYAIADKTFRDMIVFKHSQSIIVSGESGAGKTESTKYILRYLCETRGSHAGPIEQRILEANPVMESFGNAKTVRNNNSSRFGKFIELHFSDKNGVVGGYISHYLLERSRVCGQNSEERNYHIFYQICAGAPDSLKQQLLLGNPDSFNYLRKGCTQYFVTSKSNAQISEIRKSKSHCESGSLSDAILDDASDFLKLDKSLGCFGMGEEERFSIYTVIAAVLHLGNIEFEENADDSRGGCKVKADSEKALKIAATLMGLDKDELKQALLSRVMQTAKGGLKGTVIMVPLKVYEANNGRDALAKAMYSKLFDNLVHRINQSIPFSSSSHYIGILDIAGFEYFMVNSFEQFCINYCNEKLQQFFNKRILNDEQILYEKEGLGVKKISYADNQDCIELFEAKGSGIIDLLNEESKLPKADYEHFTAAVHNNNGGHFRLDLPRRSKLKDHREIRDTEGFVIRHFAGGVCYQTAHFIEKNNDALHASLEGLVEESRNPFLQHLFSNTTKSNANKGKLVLSSVSSKFRTQLSELMSKLSSTGTSFIRCIKPNLRMESGLFEGGQILSQLKCAGMMSVLELMQQGYPSRTAFVELYSMYKKYLPADLARLDPRLFCKVLFRALGLNETDYKFGLTKVFFRPGKFAEFDQLLKSDPAHLQELVSKVKKWLIITRWKKAQWCALSAIKLKNKIAYRRAALIVVQKSVRMFIAKRKFRPRILAMNNARKLKLQLLEIEQSANQLKDGRHETQQQTQQLSVALHAFVAKLKNVNKPFPEASIRQDYSGLARELDQCLLSCNSRLQQQKIAEEQEKMRALQAQMKAERDKIQLEEKRRQEEEVLKEKRAELEIRRKQEEERALLRQKEMNGQRQSKDLLKLQMIEAKVKNVEEQERHDYELAWRLATETNGGVDDQGQITPTLKRSEVVTQKQQPANDKYDLSKWKYSELRDVINTSCDIDLLEACKNEFHRRLKVYHAWKARNKKQSTLDEFHAEYDRMQRAPSSVFSFAAESATPPPHVNVAQNASRYFRIPFIRPGNATGTVSDQKSGVWYAHFEGAWIARQMELHPDKPPILLVAGRDDMQMCELSLEETGLTRKRGAEILAHDFDQIWIKNGGHN